MSFKKMHAKKMLISVAFVAVLIAGLFRFDSIPVIANIVSGQSPQDFTADPVFPVNQNGETYGPMGFVNTAGQEPDLISAVGVDGTQGYLKKKDMFGDQPNNPEEAMAYMERLEKEKASGHKFISLFASDGKTIIGEFKVW